jgi:phosphoribosylglycinamide formyltransferase-1
MRPLRVAVLASGRGSNFEAIAKANLPIQLVGVFSDKPAARALELARARGVPAIALDAKKYTDRKTFDREFFARVADAKPDLLVLAGFMRVIDASVIAAWHGRAINIHPSLLPKYAGLHTHQRAIDAGDRVHGASVHFVTAELDGGPVIAQVRIQVRLGEDATSLAARLLPLEHRLLVATVGAIAEMRIELTPSGILLDKRLLTAPVSMTKLTFRKPRSNKVELRADPTVT